MTAIQTMSTPDIEYQPDFAKFQARTRSLHDIQKPLERIPTGFPHELTSRLVWDSSTHKSESEWTYELEENEHLDIHKALLHFKCQWKLFLCFNRVAKIF
jgi:hypothetical protein